MTFLDEVDAWREVDRALAPLYALHSQNCPVETRQLSRSALGIPPHRLDGGIQEVWVAGKLAAVAYVTRNDLNRSVLVLWVDRSVMVLERA